MATNNYANASQLIDLLQAQQVPMLGAGGGFAPLGTLAFYDGTVAPQGWLACDGTVYNISDYPEYAAHIASHHGSTNFYGGNGTTTFAVPDLQGEFLRGSGTNSHANQGSGANVGVHQDATKVQASIGTTVSGLNITTESDIGYDYRQVPGASAGYYATGTSSSNRSYMTTRPTNTSFLIIVKATVSGDPNAHVYSTEEQVVGTWIDGSPVYEKTYSLTTPSTSGVATIIQLSDDINNVIDITGMIYGGGGDRQRIPVNWPYSTTVFVSTYADLLANDKAIKQNVTTYTNKNQVITIQYTKTSA